MYKLNMEEELILKAVKEFVTEEVRPRAQQIDLSCEFPRDLWNRCAELGLTGMTVAPEDGGLGLSCTMEQYIMIELAKECPALALAIDAHLICCHYIYYLGSDEQKVKYLPKLASGEMIGAVVGNQPEGMTNMSNWSPMATMTPEGLLFNTTKVMISNSCYADVFFFTGVVDGEFMACLMTKDTPGFSNGMADRDMGLHGLGHGTVRCTDMLVPYDCICAPSELSDKVNYDNASMYISISSISLGIMESAYEKCCFYLTNRKKGDVPFTGIQKIAHRLAEMKLQIELCRSLIFRVADLHEEKAFDIQLNFMTKAYVTKAAVELCTQAIQLHGGVGYNEDSTLPRHLRDAIGLTIGELPYDVLIDQVALLQGFPIQTSTPMFPSSKLPE